MSRIDRVRNPEARMYLRRARSRRATGDYRGAVVSAAGALAALVASHPEAAAALSEGHGRLRPPAVLAPFAALSPSEPPPPGAESLSGTFTSADDQACFEFVLSLALELRL
jgi:hypothetical protein